ncbi:MAG TPA: sugar phosphate nucleotidyltransferase [Anaerolineaceae bacterium]|nr:sugar phosphate nucleotidyltransferase [Anaerolineaceae bacterium]
MKTRAIILAGGEGTRLGVLTAKRTKPAVPFGGKYRIIDFPLSNCVNSDIFDVFIIAQYRPHSLIEHIGAGGPWDMDRDFSGGIRIYTPYRARSAGWFAGTADAIQQNFSFIKRGSPSHVLILSGDHVYAMNYEQMIQYHQDTKADLTMATIEVPLEEASRYGIVGVDDHNRVTSFIEKPANPPSRLVNMGVYLFNLDVLNTVLWEDHLKQDSSHDFGKDILPAMVRDGARVFAFPYTGYWVDVGTVNSYWQAHMDLLTTPPTLDLHDPDWVIHTRSEERPPLRIHAGAVIEDSLLSNGCVIESGAHVIRSVLSPGVRVAGGTTVVDSILLTDVNLEKDVLVQRAILDKRCRIRCGAHIGEISQGDVKIAMVGKNSIIPEKMTIYPGGMVGCDVIPADYSNPYVQTGEYVQTRRQPNEL